MNTGSSRIAVLLNELTQTWHQTIPVSQFMQVTPLSFDNQCFTVTTPLSPNINLHQTMFAGSIYTLMTLTGWGMLWLQQRLAGVEGNIVLADANIRYLAPVTEAPIVTVIWPESLTDKSASSETGLPDMSVFEAINNGKKAKVKLEVQLHCAGKLCATFSGLYFSY